MKRVKIKLLGFEGIQNIYDLFPGLDKDYFEFIYTDEPDFLLYSATHAGSKVYDYNCVRINLDVESSLQPDFNVSDYVLSCDNISYDDRFCNLGYICMTTTCCEFEKTLLKNRVHVNADILDTKTEFCNFIQSNGQAADKRTIIFNEVSKYKKVASGGLYLNNIGYRIGGGIGNFEEKLLFQSKCKFSLAMDNINTSGCLQEKILHAFLAKTVPIFWGDPLVNRVFNKEAFINCNDYENYDDLREAIKRVDEDDDLFLKIVNMPIFNESYSAERELECIHNFLINIFSQDPQQAFRRPLIMNGFIHEKALKIGMKHIENQKKLGDFSLNILS